jgi:Domain of unknown function (DUF2017)
VLRGLPGQVRELLEERDPSTRRLFPPAYTDDPERQAEYEQLVTDDLVAQRLQALAVVEETADAGRLTEDQLVGWLSALNDVRLVLGTRLGIEHDGEGEDFSQDDPQAPVFELYHYLGWLESQVVDALAEGIDPAGTVPD